MRSDLDPGGGHLADLVPIQKEVSFRKEGPGKTHRLDELLDQLLDGLLVAHRFDCLYDGINITRSWNSSKSREPLQMVTHRPWVSSQLGVVSK